VWNWIISDFMSRLPKWAPIVLVQTRWSLDDPSGRFQVRMADGTSDRWTIISIPALFTGKKTHPADPRTEVDEALWPSHQDTASLRNLRNLNPRDFAALYQQDPMAAGSEWPREWFGPDVWFDEWPDAQLGHRVIALDSSKGVGGKMGDYSAFVMVHRVNGIFYIDADMANDRNPIEIRQRAVELQRQFRSHIFGIEEAFIGGLCDAVETDCVSAGLPIHMVTINNMRPNEQGVLTNTPKVQRIAILGHFLQAGLLRFKNNSSGARLLVQQMMEFPLGLHDDGPDGLEMSIQIFKGW
jgi:hypothetical protein